MLLKTPLKFWQMCKTFPGGNFWDTPILHVNNARGRWNCL